MPLRSPSGICSASANGSPEAIQEFVVCESSRNPHCQLDRPASAATSCPFSHTCLYCLPFPARHSGKTQCQQCALASTHLAGVHLLKTVYHMAQLSSACPWAAVFQTKREVQWMRVFIYAMATAGLFVLSQRQVSLSEVLQRNGWLVAFIAYCFISVRLVRLSFHFIQTGDQNFWSSDHGADRPYGTGFRRSADTVDEAMRLCGRPGFHSLDQILSPIGNELRRLGWRNMNQGIAVGKNGLGADCLILGFFFFWYLLQTWRTERNTQRRNELRLIAGFLIGILYLLRLSHSATSTICLFVAILIVVFVGIRPTIKNFIGTYTLAALVLIVAAELAFGISGRLSESLGRGSDSDWQNRALGTLLTISGQSDSWGRI